jgi:DNA-binding HxlR family transcriptional regulator
MQSKQVPGPNCPILRSVERVGDWWVLMVMRDSLVYGLTRFDEFQKSLNVSTNMLTTRLNGLVEDGLLEKRQYSAHPPRYEYVPTEVGRDFLPVLAAMQAWSNRHFAPEGVSVMLQDRATGAAVDAVVVDLHSGIPVTPQRHQYVPGPAASDGMRSRLEQAERRRAAAEGAARQD